MDVIIPVKERHLVLKATEFNNVSTTVLIVILPLLHSRQRLFLSSKDFYTAGDIGTMSERQRNGSKNKKRTKKKKKTLPGNSSRVRHHRRTPQYKASEYYSLKLYYLGIYRWVKCRNNADFVNSICDQSSRGAFKENARVRITLTNSSPPPPKKKVFMILYGG